MPNSPKHFVEFGLVYHLRSMVGLVMIMCTASYKHFFSIRFYTW